MRNGILISCFSKTTATAATTGPQQKGHISSSASNIALTWIGTLLEVGQLFSNIRS
jgi:hypothetical protein